VTADLVAFLHAQLDADEQAARAATPARWYVHSAIQWKGWQVTWISDSPEADGFNQPDTAEYVIGYDGGPPVGMVGLADAVHIARHGPARVLADVEAKRRIIAVCVDAIEAGEIKDGTTWNDDAAGAEVGYLTLRLLALPFADREGYDESWRI
jgi:hypothetical protein